MQNHISEGIGQLQAPEIVIGGFNVSFSTQPSLAAQQQQQQQSSPFSRSRTLPRPSPGPRNLDSGNGGGGRGPRRSAELSARSPLLLRSPSPMTPQLGLAPLRSSRMGVFSFSQPCSPAANHRGAAIGGAPTTPLLSPPVTNASRPFALVLDNFISTFNLVNRANSEIGKIDKLQVCFAFFIISGFPHDL